MKTPTIEQAAAMAWDLVRQETDPLFSDCLKDHQEKLVYHARDVQKSGIANDPFEQMVAAILTDPTGAIAALKAKYAPPVDAPAPEPDAPPTNPLTEPAKPKRGKK